MNKALTVRPKVYKKMCTLGKAHVRDNYGFTNFEESWVNLIDDVVERHGSWDTRKLYNRWSLKEVA
jgi:hypothetical protein